MFTDIINSLDVGGGNLLKYSSDFKKFFANRKLHYF